MSIQVGDMVEVNSGYYGMSGLRYLRANPDDAIWTSPDKQAGRVGVIRWIDGSEYAVEYAVEFGEGDMIVCPGWILRKLEYNP